MANFKDVKRFCEKEHWESFREGNDHYWYRKEDAEGNLRVIKISRGTKEIGPGLFHNILKQLGVTKEYFKSKI